MGAGGCVCAGQCVEWSGRPQASCFLGEVRDPSPSAHLLSPRRLGLPHSARLPPRRVDLSRLGPEGRGRSAFPRRRPTHYTVTVPDSCFPAARPPLPRPAYHSCSEDSGSDVSSVSHAPSPGRSSPDVSFLRPLRPPEPPAPRGACREATARGPRLLLHAGFAAPEWGLSPAVLGAALEAEGAALLLPRRAPPAGRLARTPSLKDGPGGRALSRAAVSEELKSWHERARLRSARPHSLDRHGAFRVRSLPPGRESCGRALAPRAQVGPPRLSRAPAAGGCRPGGSPPPWTALLNAACPASWGAGGPHTRWTLSSKAAGAAPPGSADNPQSG